MTQFAPVKETATPVQDEARGPAPDSPEHQQGSAKPMPGLATAPHSASKHEALEFEPTGAESWSWWSADVRKAKAQHPVCLDQLDQLARRLETLDLLPTDRAALAERIGTLRTQLAGLLEGKVSVKGRPAAIALVDGAAAKIAAIGEASATAITAKAAENEKLRLAEQQRLEHEEQVRTEALARKRVEEEAQRKKDEQARAELAAKQQADAEAKAAAEKQAQEEAAAQRAVEELARKKEEAEQAKAAAEAKRLQDEQAARELAEQKRIAAEQAAQRRLAVYGDKTGAHALAQSTAEGVAHDEYTAQVGAATSARDRALGPLKKGQKKPGNATYDKATGAYESAEKQAAESKAEHKARVEEEFASVAGSASGKALSDADLSWVFGQAQHDTGYAQTLADLAVAAGLAIAKSIATDPAAATLAPKCLQLLRTGVDAKLVLRTAQLLDKGTGAVKSWLQSVPAAQLEDALDFAEKFVNALPLVAAVYPVLGDDADAETFLTGMRTCKAKVDDVAWLLGLDGDPQFPLLLREVRNRTHNPAQVRAIHTAAGGNFDLEDIARICGANSNQLERVPAILAEADPHAVTFVSLWLQVGAGQPPAPLLQVAIRAEALLADAAKCAAVTVTVSQRDRQYGRNGAFAAANTTNDARTGFLTLNFPHGRAAGVVHTHWNAATKNVGKISSMHVQGGGGNGLELNQWYQFFPRLTQAVVAAHNAAGGVLAPTGGQLSM